MSADSSRTPTERGGTHRASTQEKHSGKTDRVKGRARERLPFSDNKENKENNNNTKNNKDDKENFLIPQTPSFKTPAKVKNNNKNLIEQVNYDNRKPRSPLMAKQLPIALDDTCKFLLGHCKQLMESEVNVFTLNL